MARRDVTRPNAVGPLARDGSLPGLRPCWAAAPQRVSHGALEQVDAAQVADGGPPTG